MDRKSWILLVGLGFGLVGWTIQTIVRLVNEETFAQVYLATTIEGCLLLAAAPGIRALPPTRRLVPLIVAAGGFVPLLVLSWDELHGETMGPARVWFLQLPILVLQSLALFFIFNLASSEKPKNIQS